MIAVDVVALVEGLLLAAGVVLIGAAVVMIVSRNPPQRAVRPIAAYLLLAGLLCLVLTGVVMAGAGHLGGAP